MADFTWDINNSADRERYYWPREAVMRWWQQGWNWESLALKECPHEDYATYGDYYEPVFRFPDPRIAEDPPEITEEEYWGDRWLTKFADKHWTPYHLPLFDPITGVLGPKHPGYVGNDKWSQQDVRAFVAGLRARMRAGAQLEGSWERQIFGPDRRAPLSGTQIPPRTNLCLTGNPVHVACCSAMFAHSCEFSDENGQTSFGAGSSFADAVFGPATIFGGITFDVGADFGWALFASDANFENAQFGAFASFSHTQFGDYTKFREAHFSEAADLQSAKFGHEVDFERATFGDRSRLDNAWFGVNTNFRDAHFGDEVRFYHAFFSNWLSFSGARIGRFSSFVGAYFDGNVTFVNAGFGTGANFQGACFAADVSFARRIARDGRNPRVGQEDGPEAFGNIYFCDVKFWGDADFSNRQFDDGVDFSNASFGGVVAFHGAKLRENTLLPVECGFLPAPGEKLPNLLRRTERDVHKRSKKGTTGDKDIAELERQSRLARATKSRLERSPLYVFRRGRWRNLREDHGAWNKRCKEFEQAYRRLKLLMQQQGARNEEQAFYALEIKSRIQRRDIPLFEKLFAWLYGLTSDYGQSVTRPFGGLAATAVLFGAVFIWLSFAAGQEYSFDNVGSYLARNLVPGLLVRDLTQSGSSPYQVWVDALLKAYGAGFYLLATLHAIFNLILWFLFALALRRRFQIS